MYEGTSKVTSRSCLLVTIEIRPLFCDTVEALLLPRPPVLREEVTVPDHVAIDRVGQLASIQLPLPFPPSAQLSPLPPCKRAASVTPAIPGTACRPVRIDDIRLKTPRPATAADGNPTRRPTRD